MLDVRSLSSSLSLSSPLVLSARMLSVLVLLASFATFVPVALAQSR